MDIKITKGKNISRRVDWENFIYIRLNSIDNLAQWRRLWLIEEKEMTLNKVKPVESKNKNPQSFRGISLVQMEISGSHKEIARINWIFQVCLI